MRQNRIVTLAQAREAFPSLGESAACAQKLKAAIFEGIKEADMKEIMDGLVKKAKGGDIAAAKMLLDFVSKSAPTPQISAKLTVTGQSKINGHARLSGPSPDDDEGDPPSEETEVRQLVTTILRGDKIGKTANGLLRFINQREDQEPVTADTLLPIIDHMVSDGVLAVDDGRYLISKKFASKV